MVSGGVQADEDDELAEDETTVEDDTKLDVLVGPHVVLGGLLE
jgi:hypothetical protein